MLRIHVRLNLEDESTEGGIGRMDLPDTRRPRTWWRCERQERMQEWLDTEVVQGAAEEHGSLSCRAVLLGVESRARAIDDCDRFDERGLPPFADELGHRGIVRSGDHHRSGTPAARLPLVEEHRIRFEIV